MSTTPASGPGRKGPPSDPSGTRSGVVEILRLILIYALLTAVPLLLVWVVMRLLFGPVSIE